MHGGSTLHRIESHPKCAHGPTLLFVAQGADETRHAPDEVADGAAQSVAGRPYFACSAFRDRRLCPFFLWADERTSGAVQEKETIPERAEVAPTLAAVTPQTMRSCSIAECPPTKATRGGVKLSGNAKGLAQFMFDSAALDLIMDSLRRLNFTRVLCLGTPRLHERLLEQRGSASVVQSLLLDLDHRFAPFFGSSFVRFNMGIYLLI
jgi:hypothetical protein